MPQYMLAKAPTKSVGISFHRYWEKGIKKLQTKLNPDHTIAELFLSMVLFSTQIH
jgi:hypothetical protein